MSRGYCGIGIWHVKTKENVGTLWRSAFNLQADFLFTVGRRYVHQSSDCQQATRHLPLWHFQDDVDFWEHRPENCQLIGVELHPTASPLPPFTHPERAMYLLGAEDDGLSTEMLQRCHAIVSIPTGRSLNVATAGSIVLYDRLVKRGWESSRTPAEEDHT